MTPGQRTLGAIVCLLLIALASCVRVDPVPADSKTTDFRLAKPRAEVFDAAVAVGQRLNLDVPVLEKESGFLRFEYANVTPDQLDRYCQYPYVTTKTGAPEATFAEWSERGTLGGLIQLVLVMSEDGPAATRIAVRSRCKVVAPGDTRPRGYTNVFANECNSLGTLEKEFIDAIEARLGLR